MNAPLGDILADLCTGLEITARRLDGFQAAVARLARDAGPGHDARAIEDMQEIDAVVQRLSRIVRIAHDLAAVAGDRDIPVTGAARSALQELTRDVPRGSSDCEIF